VFHAAGPGHGKAVISSYLVANGETWRRGVVLSFGSAMVQALVAVLLVGIAAVLLDATSSTMRGAVNVIETASYALIILIGLRLLWVKGRAFITAFRNLHRRCRSAPRSRRPIIPRATITTTITKRTTITTTIITATAITTITTTTITTATPIATTMTTPRPGATRTRPSPRNSPVPAAGGAGSRR
jgi:High-affinity nickel-transport protein